VNVNNLLRGLLAVLTVAFACLIGYSMQDKSAKEGGPAPEFSIVTDQGRRVTPASFGGRVLVLNFWASWCAPCVQEIPSLNHFQRQFASSGVVVVAVSVDRNDQKYKRFLSRVPLSFETARDPNANISALYGTFQYPETYIIKDGRIMRKYPEAKDWTSDDVTQYVKGIL
jgi:cytochrome c biogenesis protein CcmG/thiol:disulfide interchange protein DsbE